MSILLENSIIDIIDKYHKIFLRKKNVIGISLGNKIIKGINTKEPCLRILVNEKLPLSELNKYDILPKTFLGVKVDVNQSQSIASTSSLTSLGSPELIKLQRPIQPGFSVGDMLGTPGTIGAIVFDNVDNSPYILSNNHVLANYNKNKTGFPIIQPALTDGGKTNNIIAYLYKKVVLNYTEGKASNEENIADCAIAKIDSSIQYNKEIYQIGSITGITDAKVNMQIKKVGRTTGYTEGTITGVHGMQSINTTDGGSANYKDVIECTPMSQGGDSGSVVLNSSNKVVGLLFAGSPTMTLLIPINKVLNLLNIHF